jgi:hypothetical protein
MMLIAYAEKDGTFYKDTYKLSVEGMQFNTSGHNFSMRPLITGTTTEVTARNVSAQWNETAVTNTTAVQFYLVSNGSLLVAENSFVEMKVSIGGVEYKTMTNAVNGVFTVPIISGEGIRKLTLYSQSYSPISTPVSAAILNGSLSTDTISCNPGTCNITLKRFEKVKEAGNETKELMTDIVFIRSTDECNVPNPIPQCYFSYGMNETNNTGFSPLKAMLLGDLSMRITSQCTM